MKSGRIKEFISIEHELGVRNEAMENHARWKTTIGGCLFQAHSLPETLQLLFGLWHQVFLSCVMLQLFIHSVQLANAKAMRIHPRQGYPRARTRPAPRSIYRSPSALFRLLAPLTRLTDAAASQSRIDRHDASLRESEPKYCFELLPSFMREGGARCGQRG
jgi:hypothetical protein